MDKKTKILTCAKQLFLEQGYKSTSIQTIANESGISKGAVYLYFNSKDEILLAIFRMLEEAVWQKVAEINSDPNLSAREKFRRQIVTFYNEILENLQFNQMMLNESGVELSEAFYNYAREYRYKLQNVQEQSLLNIYGESVRPWISDLVISINGIMQEFDASILLDNLELQSEQLADFVCHVADSIVAGLLETKPEPIFGDEARKIRSD
ncbi:MAG: TetR/AcrR family transcriptional regulator, partial [Kangiellaceae bacterium]|nr:TetR/AcrR family transcriptional regulator [Kangiellaceae bacterium]